ncbi:MAG: hypothetical protein J7M25_03895 [Deltaproteobacteria bacterium]|nr:hypothetical protein [Deltaproteobacteria bacterium]
MSSTIRHRTAAQPKFRPNARTHVLGLVRAIALAFALTALMAPPQTWAHMNSVVVGQADVQGRTTTVELQILRLDLAEALGLPQTVEPTRAQVTAGRRRIGRYLAKHIHVRQGRRPCRPLRITRLTFRDGTQTPPGAQPATKSDQTVAAKGLPKDASGATNTQNHFVVVTLACHSPILPETICLDYRLFYDLDPAHRGVWTLSCGDQEEDRILMKRNGRLPARWCIPCRPTSSDRLADRLDLVSTTWTNWRLWLASLLLFVVMLVSMLRLGAPEKDGLRSFGTLIRFVVWAPVAFWIACVGTVALFALGTLGPPGAAWWYWMTTGLAMATLPAMLLPTNQGFPRRIGDLPGAALLGTACGIAQIGLLAPAALVPHPGTAPGLLLGTAVVAMIVVLPPTAVTLGIGWFTGRRSVETQ